jgi:hypothetical protein
MWRVWSTPVHGRFTVENQMGYLLYTWLGEPRGQSGLMLKYSPLQGFDRRTVQPLASRYTD